MSITAMKQALEALEKIDGLTMSQFGTAADLAVECQEIAYAATPTIRTAIAEAEKQKPVAWRTFDGEGNYDYRTYEDNEDYLYQYVKRNGGKYADWVEPLYNPPLAPEANCKWPTCQNEVYQQALAKQITQELFTGEAQRQPLTDEQIDAAVAHKEQSMTNTLPPLPEPDILHDVHDHQCPACYTMLREIPPIRLGYSADQLREYATKAVEAEMENIINLMMIQHEAAKGRHNHWRVAANLIAAERREHVTDDSPCWCNPETTYTDPDTGASVIVHKEPQ